MIIRTLILSGILVAVVARSGSAACPVNSASSGNPGGFFEWQSSAPTWDQGIPCGRAKYDLPAGTFSLSGGGGGGKQSCSNGMNVHDVYTLNGPASPTPIPFVANLHVSGTLPAWVGFYPEIGSYCNTVSAAVTMTAGAVSDAYSNSSSYTPCAAVSFDDGASLTLAYPPGAAFDLGMYFSVGGPAAGGNIDGILTFDLPPGYTITSCQGFASQPVPTIPRSWGSLKHGYR